MRMEDVITCAISMELVWLVRATNNGSWTRMGSPVQKVLWYSLTASFEITSPINALEPNWTCLKFIFQCILVTDLVKQDVIKNVSRTERTSPAHVSSLNSYWPKMVNHVNQFIHAIKATMVVVSRSVWRKDLRLVARVRKDSRWKKMENPVIKVVTTKQTSFSFSFLLGWTFNRNVPVKLLQF